MAPGGSLALSHLELVGGEARGGDGGAGGGGGGAGMGGAIFSHQGSVSLNDVRLASDTAAGGTGSAAVVDQGSVVPVGGGGGGMGAAGGGAHAIIGFGGGGGGQGIGQSGGNATDIAYSANTGGGWTGGVGANYSPQNIQQFIGGGTGGFNGGGGGAYGGGPAGGGIFAYGGSLTFADSQLIGDSAVGGSADNDPAGAGAGLGGGIDLYGEAVAGAPVVSVSGTTFSGDTGSTADDDLSVDPTGGATPAATGLVFTAEPGSGLSGQALAPAVALEDGSGNTFDGSVNLSITPGAGADGATLRGTPTEATVDGVATFPNLALDATALGTYTLMATATATAGALTAVSRPFQIAAPPPPPTQVQATAGAGQAVVAWSASPNGEGSPATGYVVTPSGGGAPVAVSGTSTVIAGLRENVPGTFTVAAVHAAGRGPGAASNRVTPSMGAPAAPTDVGATAVDASARVTWRPPTSDGGNAITAYTVTAGPGEATATVSGSVYGATVGGAGW